MCSLHNRGVPAKSQGFDRFRDRTTGATGEVATDYRRKRALPQTRSLASQRSSRPDGRLALRGLLARGTGRLWRPRPKCGLGQTWWLALTSLAVR